MNIEKRTGVVETITALTPTANEVTFALAKALPAIAGSFVNVFMDVDGTMIRRAFSVVHADESAKTLTVAVRLSPQGTMTPEFWKSDVVGRAVVVMGPLGFNTADKFSHKNLFLFAFGVGAGVIKSLAEYALLHTTHKTITIMTGSRAEDDIIYKEYFDEIARAYPQVRITYVVSNPKDSTYPKRGYIQDHLDGLTFNDADIYMCGQEKACTALRATIETIGPSEHTYFIEAFH